MNVVDKTINYFSPEAGVKRLQARKVSQYMNTVEPLKRRRHSKITVSGTPTSPENEINVYDRQYMITLSRKMARENPIMAGLLDRIVANVIPYDGLRPNAITGDDNFDDAAENYFYERSKKCEITNRFDFAAYQEILLKSVLRDGDFGSVFTNQRRIQGIEADRIITPQAFRSEENEKVFQGVRINDHGRPINYYVGRRDKNGRVVEKDFRALRARNFIHSFRPDRIDGYRGIPVFLPVFDNLRDFQDIMDYERFALKLASSLGIKIKPQKNNGPLGETLGSEETREGTKKIDFKPGAMVFDLGSMGAEDIEVMNYDRPGDNFNSMMELLARLIGVGIGLPIELVLLDFHRGNMASIRLALIEARKTFFRHYKIVRDFSDRYYKWIISQGVKDGILVPSKKIQNNYWKVEWTEPVWEYMNPLQDIQADAMMIEKGLATFKEIALKRGKDWARLAVQLGKEHKFFKDQDVPITIGNPGSKTNKEIAKK